MRVHFLGGPLHGVSFEPLPGKKLRKKYLVGPGHVLMPRLTKNYVYQLDGRVYICQGEDGSHGSRHRQALGSRR